MESKALLVSALWYEGTYMYCQPRLWVCGRDDLLCADMTPCYHGTVCYFTTHGVFLYSKELSVGNRTS